ncbi:MAG: aquaporin family protein, partial [Rhodothermales bacterium]|nr:aquaporin family protein [Rhodothermales bacterium]
MTPFIAEIIGTGLLMLLGDGVVANVVLGKTKGHGSGWIVITMGWGFAVFVGVYTVAAFSGAHINPAVTIGLAAAGKFAWSSVPMYILAQFIGAALGAFLVWAHYKPHFAETEDADLKLAVFSTAPAIRTTFGNLVSEVIGTFVLVFGVLLLAAPEVGLGSLDALPVALLVLVIGLSLGGTTGYAINPARDLGPRIMHAILPI